MNEKILIKWGSGTIGKQIISFFIGYGYNVFIYNLYQMDDCFPNRNNVENLYQNMFYTSKIG